MRRRGNNNAGVERTFFFFFFFKIREHSRELSRFPQQLVLSRGIVFPLIFVHYQNINLRQQSGI